MLDILVPHYKEPHSVVRRLLDSIATQIGVDLSDIRVIICNDGTSLDPLPEYTFDVMVVDRPHGGVSMTRNALLDMADGEYVMLCDCDDSFSSTLGLYEVFSNMPYDVMIPSFYQESRYGYMIRNGDPYLIHGKVFRLGYLRDNDIRWMDELTCSGDNYFLWQAILLTSNIKLTNVPFYIWKYNEGSVCRSEKDYFQTAYPLTVRGMVGNVRNFMERGRKDLAMKMIGLLLFDSYFMTNMQTWDDSQPYHSETFRLLGECFKSYGFLLSEISGEMAEALYRGRQACYMSNGPESGIVGIRKHLIMIREWNEKDSHSRHGERGHQTV